MTGIVILNYFTSDEVIRLFHSLDGYPEIEILVVDNSSDRSEKKRLVDSIPVKNVIFNKKNLGYAGGNNVGIRYFLDRHDIEQVALLNPDIEIRSNIFPALIRPFQKDGKVGATGPRLCIRGEETIIYSDGGIFIRENYLKPGHINGGKIVGSSVNLQESDADYINGSFLVLNRAAIDEVGMLDETFFLYFEEADWCLRAKAAGWSLKTVTDVTAWQTISPKESVYNYYFTKNWIRFLKRYDSAGLNRLIREQLKKSWWIARDKDRPLTDRLKASYYRLCGIITGVLSS